MLFSNKCKIVCLVLRVCCCNRLISGGGASLSATTSISIDIWFSFFQIEYIADCSYDALTINIGGTLNNPLPAADRLCGTTELHNRYGAQFPLLSTHFSVPGSESAIAFTSDLYVNEEGFTLHYLFLSQPSFISRTGAFAHRNYTNNERFVW